MKKILTILIIILSVFLIYLGFKDKKVYYLSIGDYLANGINEYGIKGYSYSNYISDYLNENNLLEVFVSHTNNNMRVIDVMNDINNNSIITVNDKSKTFQNALIKADLITISLGMNDLFSNVSFNNDFTLNNLYEKLDKMLLDYDNLFSLLRQYCKENIVFIGIYNPVNEDLDDFFNYANAKINNLCMKYNINYIDIYSSFKENKYVISSLNKYPNIDGYKFIANEILKNSLKK